MTIEAPWVRRPWKWMLVNVAAWSVLATLFAIQGAVRGNVAVYQVFAHTFASFAPCAILTPGMAILARQFRFTDERRRRAIAAHLAGALAFVLIGGVMMGIAEKLVGGFPKQTMLGAARLATIGYVTANILTYVSVIAIAQAVLYAVESRNRELNEAVLLTQLAEARLHVLSSQLQPHFLFNTLHAISALVRDEPVQAERLLAKLSDLLRHVLQDGNQAETSLAKELSFLEKYVELQEARFGPRLSVQFQVDPRVVDARVPHLLLQPLVENAIRHGTSRRPTAGLIEIGAVRDGTRLQLFVRDNGAGIPDDGVVRDGIGLSSTKARLRQLYGDDHTFALERVTTGGTVCRVSVPLTTILEPAA
ncbi:MAG: histidine kinase [Gemmatimonadota bacterium]